MTEKFGSGRFCCRACANSHIITNEQKEKISKTLREKVRPEKSPKTLITIENYNKNPKHCSICGKILPFEKRYLKTCSEKCLHECFVESGKKVANEQNRRSKNEIYFYNLCLAKFKTVLHNEAIFNN